MNAAKVTTDPVSSDAAEMLATIRTANELAREEELERLKQELQELREQFVVMAARRRR
jgi:hypothetical protein